MHIRDFIEMECTRKFKNISFAVDTPVAFIIIIIIIIGGGGGGIPTTSSSSMLSKS